MTQRFIPGVESIQETIDGRKIKNTFNIEENKLVEFQVENNRKITIKREFYEKKMFSEAIFRNIKNKHWNVHEDA